MAHWSSSLRALFAGLILAVLATSCQAVFGDFKIDDSAFPDAGLAGGTGSGGDGTGASSGNGTGASSGNGNPSGGDNNEGGDAGDVPQTGPIFVDPISGLYTTEAGGQATFTVVLKVQPTANVTIGLFSDDTTEGTVSPTSLVFTKDNWNAPQLVTVTGVDDTLPDGNITYHVVTAPAVSDDKNFSKVNAADVTLINIDNETAGITVEPTSGLVTSESGMQDTFTVVLNSKPTGDVTIGLSSSRPTEGTVTPTSLVFTSVDWMAPQLVTVTGVDDTKKDGPQPFLIVTAPAKSTDHSYNGVDAPDVSVTNLDNETAGVTVTLVNGIDPNNKARLRTSENGDTATFTVQLNAPPSADVTIGLSSDSPDEGKVNPTSLTFTSLNWNAPQMVTVTGVDDQVADGDQPYNVVLGVPKTTDKDYANLVATDVPALNVDNDQRGFTVTLVSGVDPNNSSRLVTSESGDTATFTLALNSKPTGSVTVKTASSNTAEGTVSPGTLTFTTDNWNAPQTVTVTGVDDKVQDGNQIYTLQTSASTSADAGYASLDPPDIQVTNRDNDTASVVIVLTGGIDPNNSKQLLTNESGSSATFMIALGSQPTADVSLTVVSGNTKEGTVTPATVKFTALNYAAPQTITVTGVDDSIQDGDQAFVIAVGPTTSMDQNYSGKFPGSVTVTNLDNDTAGILVTPTSGLVTSEAGKTATFTIVLNSQPTADVTIGLSSSNTAEGTINVSSVLFTALNWKAPQTITVTGVQDDGVADGPQVYKIITAAAVSKDGNYGAPKNLDPPDVSATNLDDDTAGILVNPTSGLTTTEAGGTATFTVALQSKPVGPGGASATVKISFSSSKPTEGTISPTTLTFTNVNWAAQQTITITGVNDFVQDGAQPYKITATGASSTDANYNGMLAHDVSVTNIDNDTAGVLIMPKPTTTPAVTTEKGGISTFTVQLNSQPTATVSFTLTSLNTAEGTVSPGTLAFTTANWNVPQTVTVTGVNDNVADGDQLYKVRLSGAVSTDPNYSGFFGQDLPFVNQDDDKAGYLVSNISGLQTTESGGAVTFTVALYSQPLTSVTIGVSSSNTKEGTVSPASLVFTTVNWATPQTVTITGVDDNVADGPQTYTVSLANAVSTDATYSGKFGVSGTVTNLDNDTPGFTVAPLTTLQTTELGGKATFTVVLTSQPAGTSTVVLPVSSSNTKEGTVSPTSLTFTVTNWNTPQTVTVTGVPDNKVDGPQAYTVNLGPSVSTDANYQGKSPPALSANNADEDVASVTVSPTSCSTTPTTTATFSLALTSQPSDSVTIGLSSDTVTEGTVAPAMVVFTASNWNVAQTVTVTGQADGTTATATPYKIITSNASSPTDTHYNGLVVVDVACTNTTP